MLIKKRKENVSAFVGQAAVVGLGLASILPQAADASFVTDFEELSLPFGIAADPLPDYIGQVHGSVPTPFYDGRDGAGGFRTNTGLLFNTSFTGFEFGGVTFYSWNGVAYSNHTDNTTQGFDNQFGAFPGSGAEGSANFAVAFVAESSFTSVHLPVATTVESIDVTNTTYAALSMLNGDGFAKQFGGPTGDDPDFFMLTITGVDAFDQETGSVDVYLADFRFADNSQDFVLDVWETVDLTSLGDAVKRLDFTFESSDVGNFGINTPTYFAFDSVVTSSIPEPISAAVLVGVAMAMRRRR